MQNERLELLEILEELHCAGANEVACEPQAFQLLGAIKFWR